MKVLVCGSRDYVDGIGLWNYLSQTAKHLAEKGTPITEIIQGGARGADTLACQWAHLAGVNEREFRAEWGKYGKAAGPIRNKQMLDEGKPDLVIAFPINGDLNATRGTKNMVEQARAAGIATIVVGE